MARLLDEPYQPAWVDNRYGPLGGPLGINNIFTRIFQPFMGLIFYAQFGYVYTFHPKKCTDEEIKNLVDTVLMLLSSPLLSSSCSAPLPLSNLFSCISSPCSALF